MEAVRPRVMAIVRAHFRPEFLNRLDEVLLFRRLSRGDMGGIVDIQIQRLRRMLEERDLTLDLTPSGRDWLAEEGYDPVYGARPLKRVIQRELQNPLSTMILDGTLGEGDIIRVVGGRLGLTLEKEHAAAA